jgi:hypothetical protein
MSDIQNKDDLSMDFHNWKENNITKLVMKGLDMDRNREFLRLLTLYMENIPNQDKLIQLGAISAKILAINSIIEINLETLEEIQ